MLAWFSTVQFLNLGALALAAALPLLVLAYFRQQQAKKVTVSSLLILRQLQTKSLAKRKLKLPLRFFLELLCLLLLLAASLGPTLREEGKEVAIVLDNSLSMQALSSAGRSRFQEAIGRLRSFVGDQDSSLRFTVFTAAPSVKQISARSVTAKEAISALEGATPTLAAENLSAAVSIIVSSNSTAEQRYDRLVIASDQTVELASPQKSLPVTAFTLGKPVANYYLSGVQSEVSSGAEQRLKLTAQVGLADLQERELLLKVFGKSARDASNEVLLESKPLRAAPDRLVEANILLGATAAAEYSAFRFELGSASATAMPAEQNAITEDDVAYLSLRAAGPSRILLVSPLASRPENPKLGLQNVPGQSVDAMAPSEFAALRKEQLKQYSLLLFHAVAPARWQKIPTLLVLPPTENSLFPVREALTGLHLTSWMSEHPITSYLNIPLLQLGAVSVLEVPPWAMSVLHVERGSVLAAGESGGVRFAATGFEILPFEGARTPSLSILTLNLLHWLAASSSGLEASGGYLTGSTLQLAAGASAIVRRPDGHMQTIDTREGESAAISFDVPGVYQLRIIQTGTDGAVTDSKQTVAANPFHAEESSTLQTAVFRPQLGEATNIASSNSSPLWPLFMGIALVVICLELLLRLFPQLLGHRKNAGLSNADLAKRGASA